jgi:hypothetical protein
MDVALHLNLHIPVNFYEEHNGKHICLLCQFLPLVNFKAQAHHTFVDYMGTSGATAATSGWIIPQQQYSSGSGQFQPRPPIKFSDEGRWGMRVKRALDMDFRGMHDAGSQVVLSETGTKVALRILVLDISP